MEAFFMKIPILCLGIFSTITGSVNFLSACTQKFSPEWTTTTACDQIILFLWTYYWIQQLLNFRCCSTTNQTCARRSWTKVSAAEFNTDRSCLKVCSSTICCKIWYHAIYYLYISALYFVNLLRYSEPCLNVIIPVI